MEVVGIVGLITSNVVVSCLIEVKKVKIVEIGGRKEQFRFMPLFHTLSHAAMNLFN